MSIFAGLPIKWSPDRALGMTIIGQPNDPTETSDGFWAVGATTVYPTSTTDYYATPKFMQSIAHPRLNAFEKMPSFHSNASTVDLELINELELKAYPRNHGREKWICVKDGTVEVVCPYPDTIVYKTGNTVVFNGGNKPNHGLISVFEETEYWANKPVSFIAHGQNNIIVPTTLCGNSFVYYTPITGSSNIWIYTIDEGRVDIFDNVQGGITGTATQQINVGAGEIHTYSTGTSHPRTVYIASTARIVVTADKGTSAYKTVVPPTSHVVFTQRASTAVNLVGDEITIGSYSGVELAANDVTATFSATMTDDGEGDDAMMGLPFENLSNTYAYATSIASAGLSDYHIVTPYSQAISVYYLDEQGDPKWVLWGEHDFTGSGYDIYSPGAVGISGPDGTGEYDQTGAATYIRVDTVIDEGEYIPQMWKWEAPFPFYLTINDTVDAEEALLGWCVVRNDLSGGPWTNALDALNFINDYYYNWIYIDYTQ